jgi:hypothetical protein
LNVVHPHRYHHGRADYRRTRTPARARFLVTVLTRAIARLDPAQVRTFTTTDTGPTGLADAYAELLDPHGDIRPVNVEDVSSALWQLARGRAGLPSQHPWAIKVRGVNARGDASEFTDTDCLRLLMLASGQTEDVMSVTTSPTATTDQPIGLIRDEPAWRYPGFDGPARRRLRVWRVQPGVLVAVLTEHPEDPGTSITNAAQQIILCLEREYPGRGAARGGALPGEPAEPGAVLVGGPGRGAASPVAAPDRRGGGRAAARSRGRSGAVTSHTALCVDMETVSRVGCRLVPPNQEGHPEPMTVTQHDQRTPARAAPPDDGGAEPARTLDEMLASTRIIGYPEFAKMIGRDRQSLRAAANRKRKRIKAGLPPRPSDLLDPDGSRYAWPRTEPWWYEGRARKWAMQTGKLAEDGVTPIVYRGGTGKGMVRGPRQRPPTN